MLRITDGRSEADTFCGCGIPHEASRPGKICRPGVKETMNTGSTATGLVLRLNGRDGRDVTRRPRTRPSLRCY